MRMNAIEKVAYILLVIGGINWGLVGAFKYNLVDSIFGEASFLARVIYVIVGLAAVYGLVAFISHREAANA